MRKLSLISLLILCVASTCNAQKNINYLFESPIIDSINNGVNYYQTLTGVSSEKLKLYAVLVQNFNEYEIYLNEYSYLSEGGFLKLIQSSKRYIVVAKNKSIPVIFTSDKLSTLIRDEKISEIPLTGYYIKISDYGTDRQIIKTQILY